ncbi:MAG: CAP domain-containing protein [Candidatus Competibacteraceae bacterium]|nr:CAP domain-containing protein [Candidatus Competibacteraceae bacterium]
MLPYIIIFIMLLLIAGPIPAQEEGDLLAGANYLSHREKSIIRETNAARSDPDQYVRHLKDYRADFDGKVRKLPGNVRVMTQEGTAAVDEAIEFLQDQQPLPSLEPSRGLTKAARDHAEDIGFEGLLSHRGSDGSLTPERVNRYGRWLDTVAENIAFGPVDGRRVVIRLIVDDGVPDRGHRRNIFNDQFNKVGVACEPHDSRLESVCVMVYAGGFQPD